MAWKNQLHYGDNLEILRGFSDECVDLIYLDPPFNSNASYNVLFQEKSGEDSPAQIRAFEDTWEWDQAAAETYFEITTRGPEKVRKLISSLHEFLVGASGKQGNDMMAYLVMMSVRLLELHRVLKSTGSLYLHCDPTASHYLKLLLDAVFGVENFRNEIIWKRTSGHSDARRYGRVHDVILFYSKTGDYKWNQVYQDYDQEYIDKYYRYKEEDGRRFMSDNLAASSLQGGGYEYEWNGITRVWRCPQSRMQELHDEGRIYYTRNGIPRLKRYLDEAKGLPAQDVWTDVEALRSWHDERLGYPTQKPEALLERLILSSSDEGDIVLDPFCGCGTTVAAAENLDRRWIGIDVTHLAVALMKRRLHRSFPDDLSPYEIRGVPTDVPSAEALAKQDRYEFQDWAVGLIEDALPYKLRGPDGGIDGVLRFMDDDTGKAKLIIIQVKSGKVERNDIATLKGDMEREGAAIGVFVTLQHETRPMRDEALDAGFYESPFYQNRTFPRVQILRVEDLLEGEQPDYPRMGVETFKQAQGRSKKSKERGLNL